MSRCEQCGTDTEEARAIKAASLGLQEAVEVLLLASFPILADDRTYWELQRLGVAAKWMSAVLEGELKSAGTLGEFVRGSRDVPESVRADLRTADEAYGNQRKPPEE
jgi:hypothetical protein